MSIAELIPIAINLSIALIVLSLGLSASLGDAAHLLRHPGLLFRSVLSMSIAMPIFACVLVTLIPLHPALKIAIVSLALSPVPPFLPSTQEKAGGNAAYVVSLLVTTSLLAIVLVPLGAGAIDRLYGLEAGLPIGKIAWSLILTVTLPLLAGMVVHQLAEGWAMKLVRPVLLAGYALLIAALIPVLFTHWNLLVQMIGEGTLLILTLFAIIGIVIGHFLGGPVPQDRVVLALATASRHPGVALMVALAHHPDQPGVLSVVFLHLLVGMVIGGIYSRWMHLAQPVRAVPKAH